LGLIYGWKRQKYEYQSLEFKIKLVTLYLEGKGGYRTLAKEYGLKSGRQIRDWVKKYKNGELTEENSDRRGKCTFIKKTFKNTDEKNEYLKIENEYLKKNCFQWENQRSSLQIYGHQRI